MTREQMQDVAVDLTETPKSGNNITQDAPLRAGDLTGRHRASGAEDSKPGEPARTLSLCDRGNMTSTDTSQTQQTDSKRTGDLVLNSRADLRDLLIQSGLARAAAEKVARGGWPALSGEQTEQDLAEECTDLARALASKLLEN